MKHTRNFPYCKACRDGYEIGKEVHHSGDAKCRFYKHTNLHNEIDEYNTPFTWLDYILYGIAILVVAGVLAVFVTEVIFGEMITRWMYSV